MSLREAIAEVYGEAAEGRTDPSDSIRAPLESIAARNESVPAWQPVPLSQLGESEPIPWLWDGYLAVGFITLLTGLWKGGKTTLVAWLLRLLAEGGELAGAVKPARVLVVSEENNALWRRRRDELRIGDHVHLMPRPFHVRPKLSQWESFALHLAELVHTGGYTVVIVDTLPSFWPVVKENDASEVIAAMTPLRAVAETGAAVLVTHHPRKGDAAEAQASRGSGALTGFVDIIVELRRHDAGNREDRRRVLTGYSRFEETAPEAVIELGDDGYRLVGTKADARQADRLAAIAELLPPDPPGITADELLSTWPDTGPAKPGKRTLQLDLKAGAQAGRWAQLGTGTRNDSFRFTAGDMGGGLA
jgi:hypothetical protein